MYSIYDLEKEWIYGVRTGDEARIIVTIRMNVKWIRGNESKEGNFWWRGVTVTGP